MFSAVQDFPVITTSLAGTEVRIIGMTTIRASHRRSKQFCREELNGNMSMNNITLLRFRHSAREYRRNMIKVDKTGLFLTVFSNLPR